MTKYIIYKTSGGFAHSLRGLSYAIYLAKKHNRTLMIDYKGDSIFNQNFSNLFYINDNDLHYTDNYNDIPDNLTFQNLTKDEIKNLRVKCKMDSYFINDTVEITRVTESMLLQPLIVITRTKVKNNFNLNIKINKNVVKNIIESNPTLPKEYISVHFRNTDKKNDMGECLKMIKKCSEKTKIITVYIATDDFKFYGKVVEKFPNLNFFRFVTPYDTKGKGMHYFSTNKKKMMDECLTDIYVILKSTIFIPSVNSGLSQIVIQMSNEKKNIFDIKTNCKIYGK